MISDCVIDASVAIKLFLQEEDSDKADLLFTALTTAAPARFYVPDLFFVECGNVLWKYVRFHGYPPDSARQDVAALKALKLLTVSTADLLSNALELAFQFEVTAYDAVYVALAKQLNLPLITADSSLVKNLENSELSVLLLNAIFDE